MRARQGSALGRREKGRFHLRLIQHAARSAEAWVGFFRTTDHLVGACACPHGQPGPFPNPDPKTVVVVHCSQGLRLTTGRSSSLLFSVLNFVSDPARIRGKDDAVEET